MANRAKSIVVAVAEDIDSFEKYGPRFEETHCETISEAKKRAKYLLTEDYRLVIEASSRLGYAQVVVDGECHSDYFGSPEPQGGQQ